MTAQKLYGYNSFSTRMIHMILEIHDWPAALNFIKKQHRTKQSTALVPPVKTTQKNKKSEHKQKPLQLKKKKKYDR